MEISEAIPMQRSSKKVKKNYKTLTLDMNTNYDASPKRQKKFKKDNKRKQKNSYYEPFSNQALYPQPIQGMIKLKQHLSILDINTISSVLQNPTQMEFQDVLNKMNRVSLEQENLVKQIIKDQKYYNQQAQQQYSNNSSYRLQQQRQTPLSAASSSNQTPYHNDQSTHDTHFKLSICNLNNISHLNYEQKSNYNEKQQQQQQQQQHQMILQQQQQNQQQNQQQQKMQNQSEIDEKLSFSSQFQGEVEEEESQELIQQLQQQQNKKQQMRYNHQNIEDLTDFLDFQQGEKQESEDELLSFERHNKIRNIQNQNHNNIDHQDQDDLYLQKQMGDFDELISLDYN